MTANQLLSAYRAYADANAKADEGFDITNFPNLPERPEMTSEAKAGELINERGLQGALKVAEFGLEDPDCSELVKTAYQLIIEVAR